MKTTNNAQKTENRIFENLIQRSLMLLATVAIGSGLFANDAKTLSLTENDLQENTLEFVSFTDAFVAESRMDAIASRTFFIDSAKEEKLEIENWMTSDKHFKSFAFTVQNANEEMLEIESWMTTNEYFAKPVIALEKDKALKVEKWMTNDSVWVN